MNAIPIRGGRSTPQPRTIDPASLIWGADVAPVLSQNSLIHDLLGRQTLAGIVGGPGTGKSTLAIDLGQHVACGDTWRDLDCNRTGVLYLAPEGSIAGARNRLAAHYARHPHHRGAPFALLPQLIDLHGNGDVDAILELMKAAEAESGEAIGLIVVDTLARAMGSGDENTAGDMGAFVRNCDRLRLESGAAVLVVHHHGKDASRGARGHNSFFGALDTEITVTGTENPRLVEITKQRDLPSGQRYAFELTPVDLGIDERGRPVTACVVDHIDEAPPKANARVTGKHQIALLAGIREWARSHPGAPLSSMDLKEIARVQNVPAKRRPEVVFSLQATGVLTPAVGGFTIAVD